MAKAKFPAHEYASAVSLLHMERGGFKRWSNYNITLWFFKLPDGTKTIEVEDSLVPTVDNKPVITLGQWTLDKGKDGKMWWTRNS